MTIRDALRSAHIDPLDAELLLAHALGMPREHLLAHPDERIRPSRAGRFRRFVARRRMHEPVAFILGHKHFYDLTLAVRRGVLIPRPETELLVDEALEAATAAGDAATIVDVGTGSGAIALALARHLSSAQGAGDAKRGSPAARSAASTVGVRSGRTRTVIIATDTSPLALRLAKKNARMLGLTKRVRFVQANMLPGMGERKVRPYTRHATRYPLLIVANLPYLPTAVWRSAPPDVKRFEPRSALDGGRDGLDAYRALFAQVAARGLRCTILIEIDPTQKRLLPHVVKSFFPKTRLSFKKDLAGRWRMALIKP